MNSRFPVESTVRRLEGVQRAGAPSTLAAHASLGLRFAARKPALPTARLPTIVSDHIRARSTHLPRTDLERAALSQGHRAIVFHDHGIEMASVFGVVLKLLESSTILHFIVAMPGYLSTSPRTSLSSSPTQSSHGSLVEPRNQQPASTCALRTSAARWPRCCRSCPKCHPP